jgi:hypothetical protein
MMSSEQFRLDIIRPVLEGLQLYTPVAEELLIATMAHESKGGAFLKQTNGSALGVYQMEPKTHDDIWLRFMPNHSEITHRLMTTCVMSTKPSANMMIFNLYYATAMARIFYLDCKAALPATTDIDVLWLYYKQWWNTNGGKATYEEFLSDYCSFTGKEKPNENRKKGK